MFEIEGNTIKYFEKERNGDHFLFEDLKNEKILIAIVADGVSRQPCDWHASSQTCKKLLKWFKSSSESNLKSRIKESILRTNKSICKTDGDCESMSSTLSLFVWDYHKNFCLISNVGDSRIYKSNGIELQQLTVDDAITGTKEIITPIGRRTITTSSLTSVIGMLPLSLKIKEIDFKQNEMILLSSDGFYDARKSSFHKDMLQLAESNQFKEDFNAYFSRDEMSTRDDMTAIVIKNNIA